MSLFLGLWLALAAGGCAHGPAPPPSGVPALQPGRFLEAYYLNSAFDPAATPCALGPITVEAAQGVTTEVFRETFSSELARAWTANGLKPGPADGPCRLTAVVHRISLHGTSLRFLLGRISARLVISGAITRNGEVLFAFRDRLSWSSPLSPGAAAPRETELLLQAISRALAHRLLDEMLLQGTRAPSG